MRPKSLAVSFNFSLSAYLLSALLLSGCSSLYILRAAYEEGKILWRRQPIEEVLQSGGLDAEKQEKLKMVLVVREYARDSLGLRVGGSYASYSYVDRSALTYVLTVAPKTDLAPYTWWYLFVGRVPYKGFFSERAAKDVAQRFETAGYDTHIRTSPAFSTLGWFDDPLLAHLLEYGRVTLAEVIFHELLHNTLFLSGAVDFNESLANFVGKQAAIQFFRERYGEASREYQRAVQNWKDELQFSAFIAEVAHSLSDLYAREIPLEEKLKLREGIFTRSGQEWSRRIADRPRHRYRGFSQERINNAVIASYLLYLKELELFESVYEAQGKKLARFVELIGESIDGSGDPFAAVRELAGKKAKASISLSQWARGLFLQASGRDRRGFAG